MTKADWIYLVIMIAIYMILGSLGLGFLDWQYWTIGILAMFCRINGRYSREE